MLIAGNWKLFKGPREAREFCTALAAAVDTTGVEVAVCPPYVSLAAALEALQGSAVQVFAQSVHWAAEGAFTGEVSAAMLAEVGVAGAIVGHSERRQYFGETDETVARRSEAALAAGLRVIACVGETLAERDGGRVEEVLRRQTAVVAAAVGAHANLVVAYEPVWAIGTGRTASPEQAQEAHAIIRAILDVPILYGGSVKADNAPVLLAQPDVDGALVGGAALDVASFAGICAAARAVA
jgi:triosephosphate isomerase